MNTTVESHPTASAPPENTGGVLYLVATPIGNLSDLTYRAVDVLRSVDLIAAEDTRHSRRLLDHYGIGTRMVPLHEHNEDSVASKLLERLRAGDSIALISDAGSPLISDPGFPLVRLASDSGVRVSPVPGPCALIAALSASGLSCERFVFDGFLPRQRSARRERLAELRDEPRTVVCYEASHRILETLRDLADVFPAERALVVARELTKIHETLLRTTVGAALRLFETDVNLRKGEFVLIVEGAPASPGTSGLSREQIGILQTLLTQCSVKTAAHLAAELTGASRSLFYAEALRLKDDGL